MTSLLVDPYFINRKVILPTPDGVDTVKATGAKLTHFRLSNDGVERRIDMIAREEIELAVFHLVEDQFGMQRDSVPHAVAHLLRIKQLRAEGPTLIVSVRSWPSGRV